MLTEFLAGIATDLVWALLGALILWLVRLVFRTLPTKRLWRLAHPGNLVVCAANSTTTDTGKYRRAATGIGQVRALVLLIGSLNRAYKRELRVQNVLLSHEPLQNRLEQDIILLGGPKNNQFTRLLLDKLDALSIVNQDENEIIWLANGDREVFLPTASRGRVERDFGIALRMRNPFATHDTTICLFAGGHTYGTIAAARYFTEHLYHDVRKLKRLKRNVALLVSCDVVGGYPSNVALEREHQF